MKKLRMKRHHTIITGTGRAGTTFLVHLLTALGLDTGFTDPHAAISENCNAGMELDIQHPEAPYIIKGPLLCSYLDSVLESGEIVIDHAFIPMRDLFSAAESRRDVTRRTDSTLHPKGVPGGLWNTDRPEQQEAILADQLYQIIYTIAKRDITVTLLHFPKFINDPEYLYTKMEALLKGIKYERFLEEFKRIARPELVHNFESGQRAGRATIEWIWKAARNGVRLNVNKEAFCQSRGVGQNSMMIQYRVLIR
jgi:hypothetical protein